MNGRGSSKRDICQKEILARAFDELPCVPCVEAIVGEVNGYAGGIFFGDGGNEKGVAVEELELVGECVGVGRVLKPEGLENGCAVESLLVEACVDVIEETIADIESVACCFGNGFPEEEFLRERRVTVVVSHKSVKSSQRGPACTERLGGVASETTNVAADHGHLEECGEIEHALDRVAVVVPYAQVVS